MRTVVEVIDSKCSEDTAVYSVADGQSLTYRQLIWRANRLCQTLKQLGVGKETKVAVCVEEGVNLVISELAVLKAGGCFVPMEHTDPLKRFSFLLRDCDATVLLASKEHARGLSVKLSMFDRALWTSAHPCSPKDAPGCNKIVKLCVVDDYITEVETISGPKPGESTERRDSHIPYPSPEDACHVIYTSGSTGIPKGVVVEHGSLLHYCKQKNRVHGIDKSSRILLVSAKTWDPSLGDIFSALCAGAVLCVAPRGGCSDIYVCMCVSDMKMIVIPTWFTRTDERSYDIPITVRIGIQTSFELFVH